MDFSAEIQKKAERFENRMRAWFAEQKEDPANRFAEELLDVMEYSMLAGGKRLRPVLLLAAHELFGGQDNEEVPFRFALALEMIHTHSLMHDDLPAIDDDALRRGRPTAHVQYGEALALLAGDALLNQAFAVAAGASENGNDEGRVLACIRALTEKTGVRGMLGGQTEDVKNEKRGVTELTREQLDAIYTHKTSALLEAPLMIGGMLGGADQGAIKKLEEIGRRLGLAFQIQDDILDVTSDAETLGKPIRSDEKNEKTTYVTLLGIEGAAAEVARLTDEALALAAELPGRTEFLTELISRLAKRKQ